MVEIIVGAIIMLVGIIIGYTLGIANTSEEKESH